MCLEESMVLFWRGALQMAVALEPAGSDAIALSPVAKKHGSMQCVTS